MKELHNIYIIYIITEKLSANDYRHDIQFRSHVEGRFPDACSICLPSLVFVCIVVACDF